MDIKVLPSSAYKEMKWKNGLGTTTEFLIEPTDASVGDLKFDWRLSSAACTVSGPFSSFDGYKRVLVQLPSVSPSDVKSALAPSGAAGAGTALLNPSKDEPKLTLTHSKAGHELSTGSTVTLTPFVPYTFDGSLSTYSAVTAPLKDVGLILKRETCDGVLQCKRLTPSEAAQTFSFAFNSSKRWIGFVYVVDSGQPNAVVSVGTDTKSAALTAPYELKEHNTLVLRSTPSLPAPPPNTAAAAQPPIAIASQLSSITITVKAHFPKDNASSDVLLIVGEVSYL